MTGSPSGRKGLPRARRLQTKRDFIQIREQGQRLAKGCLIANWMLLPQGCQSRLGVVTSRRIGNAVRRSRARRLLREAFRLHQFEFNSPLAVVLVARASINGKKLSDVERDYLTVLRRAGLLGQPL